MMARYGRPTPNRPPCTGSGPDRAGRRASGGRPRRSARRRATPAPPPFPRIGPCWRNRRAAVSLSLPAWRSASTCAAPLRSPRGRRCATSAARPSPARAGFPPASPAWPTRAGAAAPTRSLEQQVAEQPRRDVGPQRRPSRPARRRFPPAHQRRRSCGPTGARRDCRRRRATTSRSPRRTSTSVTASRNAGRGRQWRADAPGSWSRAMSTRSASASRRDCVEHRAGHRDIVVLREPPHHFGRRVATGARRCDSSARALTSISTISRVNTPIEQPDMVVVELARAVEEQRGDAPERLRPSLGRAVLDDLLQFRNERAACADILNSCNGGMENCNGGAPIRRKLAKRI